MNPLAYADMNTDGKEDIFGLFKFIAQDEVEAQVTKAETSDSNMKTTSVRLQEKQLQAFDAVIGSFGLTRNQAFSYAMTQFMSDAIAGYAYGRAEALDDINALGDVTFEQSVCNEHSAFIKRLGLDEEMHTYLASLTGYELFKRLGVE